MKGIFSILIAINILIAGWYLSTGDSSKATDNSIIRKSADVGDLKIVSDIELKVRADYQRKLAKQIERFEKENAALKKETRASRSLAKQLKQKDGCLRLGPFDVEDDAEAVSAGLLEHRIVSKVVEDRLQRADGYWALVTADSSEDAKKLMKQLREQGFEDIRILAEDGSGNDISLGLFKQKINAIRQKRRADELGLLTIVKPKIIEQAQFWLEFEMSGSKQFPVQAVTNSFPNVQIKTCFGIASE